MKLLIAVGFLWLVAGCQPILILRPSSSEALLTESVQVDSAYLSQREDALPTDPVGSLRAVPAGTGFDPLSQAAQIIAEQLVEGLSEARVKRFPMTILPFGALPGHAQYEQVGERVSESLFHSLQSNSYNLIDYRVAGMPDRAMPEVSEQDISQLRSRNRIYFVLVGNYANYPDGLVINARVLDTTTRQVLAAGQVHIANEQLEGRLPGYDPLLAGEKGMIVETRGVPQGVLQ